MKHGPIGHHQSNLLLNSRRHMLNDHVYTKCIYSINIYEERDNHHLQPLKPFKQ